MCQIKMGGIEGRQYSQGSPNNFYNQTHSPTEQADKWVKVYGDTVMEGAKALLTGDVSDAVKAGGQTLVGGVLSNLLYKPSIPTGTQHYGNNTAGIRQQNITRNRGSIPGRKPR